MKKTKNLYLVVASDREGEPIADGLCQKLRLQWAGTYSDEASTMAVQYNDIAGIKERHGKDNVVVLAVSKSDNESLYEIADVIIHDDIPPMNTLLDYLARYVECCEGLNDCLGGLGNDATLVQVFNSANGASTFCSDCCLDVQGHTITDLKEDYSSLGTPLYASAVLNETEALEFCAYPDGLRKSKFQFVYSASVEEDAAITEQDISFLSFVLEQHIKLLHDGYSSIWTESIEKEGQHADKILAKLKKLMK